MPITEELMGPGAWQLSLRSDTPTAVLNSIDVRSYLWATIVVTPLDWEESATPADADILAAARYTGVYLGMGDGRRTLFGQGLSWWLGADGDGGELYAGVDSTTGAATFATQLTNQVFSRSNGITAGSIDATATTYTVNLKGGDAAREILDANCAMAPGGPNMWRINSSTFTLDADDQTTLWPTTATPTTILGPEGGQEPGLTGLYAEIDIEEMNGEEVRTNVQVEWNEATPGTNNGTSSPSLPSTYGNLTGGSPIVRTLIHWSPAARFPPVERWRVWAARAITATARANSMASREANERTNVRPQVRASMPDIYDPWRYTITPGNTVYLWDVDQNLVTAANEVYYRGETTHPSTGRVDEMETPILNGYGVFLRYWTGAAFAYYRLTPYVEWEEGPTTVRVNYRDRFPLGRVRPRRVTPRQRRLTRRWAHQQAQLQRYFNS
jgi:hypothetical protein